MNVGSFSIKGGRSDGEVIGKGSLATLLVGFDFDVMQGSGAVGSDQPALQFFVRNPMGKAVQVGAAWMKSYEGRDFYSITFDDPSFDKPLNVAAWPVDGKPGAYGITFSRPRPKQVAA